MFPSDAFSFFLGVIRGATPMDWGKAVSYAGDILKWGAGFFAPMRTQTTFAAADVNPHGLTGEDLQQVEEMHDALHPTVGNPIILGFLGSMLFVLLQRVLSKPATP